MIHLPEAFITYTRNLLGDEAFEKLQNALSDIPPVSLRLNSQKWHETALALETERVPWASRGYYLTERPAFTFDPLFHAGCYYVQEASSMFLEQAIQKYVQQPCTVLDLCAAPGGKSTHLASLLPEGSLLLSNEVIRSRAQILTENLIKWGNPAVVVSQNDPADFASFPELFDVIVTDVPCSGEGMFRKDADSIEEWTPANIETCWKRQRRILADIWRTLKPGGLLIYSTCTYNALENEENIRWIMQEYGATLLPIPTEKAWDITGDLSNSTTGTPLSVYRFLPSHTRGEGFFMAVLRKPIEENSEVQAFSGLDYQPTPSKKRKKASATPSLPPSCLTWIKQDQDFSWEITNNQITAFPTYGNNYLELFRKHLHILHAGITVAELKGRDWIPHHALAMSTSLQKEAFPTVELSYTEAIDYLRREILIMKPEVSKGFVLVTYKDIPLGFVKNIGNRANNFYPQEWRIRSAHIPEESNILR